ncbi:MAG: T9SS type A sorting domain-containing protein [Fluviicola sp.]|nr:T9SS type A sorting domain-containing protein [Fluviicola sp.]
MKLILSTLFVLYLAFSSDGQVNLTVTVNSGFSGTSCTDGVFGSPDPQWGVGIAAQGWWTYPAAGGCFNNTPNVQYSEIFNCPSSYPNLLQVCFRAFEDDGSACVPSTSCLRLVCQNFATPAIGNSVNYTLTIPNCCGNTSWGSVSFTITATGSYPPGSAYDIACNAINLGTLNNGGTLGNNGLSNYGNFCATATGDPNPWGGSNDQGVWFQFTTDNNPSSVINIEGVSDPQGFGDAIDLQIALYESSNGLCNGTASLIQEEYDFTLIDETLSASCLQPNTTYYILIDGESTLLASNQEGFFGLQISDNGVVQAGDEICDSENLGLVTAAGSVGTSLLSQTNSCASNTNDPTPSAWGPNNTVWYQFQAPPSGSVIIDANSDLPFPVGTNAIDIELAVYGSSNNLCNGALTEISSGYNAGQSDENLTVRCLNPGDNYWIMLDGSALNVEGIFDITITDEGIPPASNNSVCNAIALGSPSPGGTVGLLSQNNYCADNLFEPVSSNWSNDQGVWFSFDAPLSGKVDVNLTIASIFANQIDLQVAIYDLNGMTCAGFPTEIASQHILPGIIFNESMTVGCLIPGRTYWILVDGEASLSDPSLVEGLFNIEVFAYDQDPPIGNNTPCTAISLGDPTGSSVGTTPGAIHGSQNNFCADAIGEPIPSSFIPVQTVWYSFIAPYSGSVNVTVISDLILGGVDPINLQMAVYENSSCAGSWVELYSGSSATNDVATTLSCLIAGQTYYIQIDGELPAISGGNEGYFDITIADADPIYGTGLAGDFEPANNICNNAASLSVQSESCSAGSGSYELLNYGQPTNTFSPAFVQACGSNCGDTWYEFTIPPSGSVIIEGEDDGVGVFNDFSTTNIIIYSGTCGSLTPIDCQQGGAGNDILLPVSGLPGSTIWVQIFNEGGNDNLENYQLCVFEGCGFDDCLGATINPMAPNVPYCFNTSAATGENISGGDPGYIECLENDNPENSIYFSFTTDAVGGDVTISIDNVQINGACVLGSPTDGFNVSIYEDNTPCDNAPTNLLDCQSFDACDVLPITWIQTYSGLSPNTTYVIIIDGGLGNLGGNNSGEIMISGAIPLFVELTDFFGENINRTNKLYWESATESENDYYTLERSIDGNDFNFMTNVSGAGSTQVSTNYSYTDDSPEVGVNYYRLSQTDFDGQQKIIKTIAVNTAGINSNMSIIPNPINDFPVLLIKNQIKGEGGISIVDAAGRTIQFQSINLLNGFNSIILNTQKLLTGIYFVQLKTEFYSETIRFVKSK